MRKRPAVRGLRRHGGAAVVEFAFVFPILFMLTYGAVVYSYAYVLRQSLTFAAQEAAEAAVDIDPTDQSAADYKGAVTSSATATAVAVVAWMPERLRSGMGTSVQLCSEGGGGTACPSNGGDAVVVTLTLPLTGNSQLFATMNLPFVGTFPPLPATMTAQATARV